jgi:hypothetical protein
MVSNSNGLVLKVSCRKYVNDEDRLDEKLNVNCVEPHHALCVPPIEYPFCRKPALALTPMTRFRGIWAVDTVTAVVPRMPVSPTGLTM